MGVPSLADAGRSPAVAGTHTPGLALSSFPSGPCPNGGWDMLSECDCPRVRGGEGLASLAEIVLYLSLVLLLTSPGSLFSFCSSASLTISRAVIFRLLPVFLSPYLLPFSVLQGPGALRPLTQTITLQPIDAEEVFLIRYHLSTHPLSQVDVIILQLSLAQALGFLTRDLSIPFTRRKNIQPL